MIADEKASIICMSCMTPNDGADKSCRNCRASLSGTSSLDPVKMIQNEGAMWRKAVSAPPKLIVLIGTWILFVPWIIISIVFEIIILANWHGFPSLIFFLFVSALFLVGAVIIYSVTKNYQTARKTFAAEKQNDQLKNETRLQAKARRQERIKNKKI